MPKRKKTSSRRPALSGPPLSPASPHRNNPIMLEEDENPPPKRQVLHQNSILIDDETESQTQNPTMSTEEVVNKEDEEEDLVEIQDKGAILEGGLDGKGGEEITEEESRKAASKRKKRQRGRGAEKKLKQVQNPISVDDDKEDFREEDVKDCSKEAILVVESQNTQEDEKPQLGNLENHEEGVDLDGDSDREVEENNDEAEKQEERQGEEDKQMDHEELEGNKEPPSTPNTRNVSRRTAKKKKQQRTALEKKLKQVENPISIEEDSKEIEGTDLVENEKDSSKTQNPISVEEEKVDLVESQNTDLMGEEQVPGSPHPEQEEEEYAFGEFNHNSEGEEKQQEQQGEDKKHIEQEEPEGMSLSPPLHVPPADEGLVLGFELNNQLSAPNVSRKPPKRKRLNIKQRQALEKKLKLVKQNLQPIPFVPEKNLDFSKDEELMKRLGLWDFVNMQFDQDIRSDLLALLIANYTPSSRGSVVNSCRIKLSRADLARALKLPVKKDKSNSLEAFDFDSEALSDESILFLAEFLSTWILLHEDTWILPTEVVTWEALVRKGQPHKVDWPGLIWFMVEKELTQAQQIGKLYYASHIQCLMKSQRPELFEEEPGFEERVHEEEDALDLKMGSLEDYQCQELEKQQTEMSLGQEKNENEQQYREEDMMDYQRNEEHEGTADWFLDEKSHLNDHCLRRCNLNETQNLENQHIMHGEDEEGYGPESKCTNLGGLSSADLLGGIGTTNITYNPSLRFHGQSSGDLFESRVDTHLNPGDTSLFGDDNIADHRTLTGHHKRMTNDASSMDFNFCMEQINLYTSKARVMYEEKEQAYRSHVNEELIFSGLQQQKQMLNRNLEETRYDLQMKEVENFKLEQELLAMSNLLEGYRKALKENRRLFSEYRERHPEPAELLYKDVGPGGIVLSINEIEKQRLEQEEEENKQRDMMEQIVYNFERNWKEKLREYENVVHNMDTRLLEWEENVKFLKEISVNRKRAEHSQ